MRVKRLFEEAVEKRPTERAAYLESLSALDPELRTEVERLLDADRDDNWPASSTRPSPSTARRSRSGGRRSATSIPGWASIPATWRGC
jgi:hypothetical protein